MERDRKIIDIIERTLELSELNQALFLSHLFGRLTDDQIKDLERRLILLEEKESTLNFKLD